MANGVHPYWIHICPIVRVKVGIVWARNPEEAVDSLKDLNLHDVIDGEVVLPSKSFAGRMSPSSNKVEIEYAEDVTEFLVDEVTEFNLMEVEQSWRVSADGKVIGMEALEKTEAKKDADCEN